MGFNSLGMLTIQKINTLLLPYYLFKKKKLLSYFNSTYQAFKKKRPVKTKNFPKLGDSALPQSSCKAPNPA